MAFDLTKSQSQINFQNYGVLEMKILACGPVHVANSASHFFYTVC